MTGSSPGHVNHSVDTGLACTTLHMSSSITGTEVDHQQSRTCETQADQPMQCEETEHQEQGLTRSRS